MVLKDTIKIHEIDVSNQDNENINIESLLSLEYRTNMNSPLDTKSLAEILSLSGWTNSHIMS